MEKALGKWFCERGLVTLIAEYTSDRAAKKGVCLGVHRYVVRCYNSYFNRPYIYRLMRSELGLGLEAHWIWGAVLDSIDDLVGLQERFLKLYFGENQGKNRNVTVTDSAVTYNWIDWPSGRARSITYLR